VDEVQDFCVRMLGPGEAAAHAAQAARVAAGEDRLSALTAAVASCRQGQAGGEAPNDRPASGADDADVAEPVVAELAQAVAVELAQATARLPQRQREALALRERLGLTYAEIGAAIGMEPQAVAPLLARARLRLRSELRGTEPAKNECTDRDRALSIMVRRRDGEEVPAADEDWLIEHLGHCGACAQAHSALLEASACYRAWRLPEAEPPATSDAGSAAAG
jgi:RNA polymerase sigma factor (sigma-70 family)